MQKQDSLPLPLAAAPFTFSSAMASGIPLSRLRRKDVINVGRGLYRPVGQGLRRGILYTQMSTMGENPSPNGVKSKSARIVVYQTLPLPSSGRLPTLYLPSSDSRFLPMAALSESDDLACVELLADVPSKGTTNLPTQRSTIVLVSRATWETLAVLIAGFPPGPGPPP